MTGERVRVYIVGNWQASLKKRESVYIVSLFSLFFVISSYLSSYTEMFLSGIDML